MEEGAPQVNKLSNCFHWATGVSPPTRTSNYRTQFNSNNLIVYMAMEDQEEGLTSKIPGNRVRLAERFTAAMAEIWILLRQLHL